MLTIINDELLAAIFYLWCIV